MGVQLAQGLNIVNGARELRLPVDKQNADFFAHLSGGNDSNLLIVFYVQIMPDDFVMQLHRF
ncbi:hypothetical protein B5762_00615 [Escherichia coli]|nr:hypothetical protein B5762_00615 [Escherichia coli]